MSLSVLRAVLTTALVLIALVFGMNFAAIVLRSKMRKKLRI